MKKALLLLLACLVLVSVAAVHTVRQWWVEPVEAVGGIVTVGNGGTLSAVATELAQRNALTWPRLWTLLARFQGLDASIKRGEYALDRARSPAQLLAMLVDGDVITYSVTLPEGIRLAEALALLQQEDALKVMLDGHRDPRLADMVAPADQPEGWFFPDTYVYHRGDSDLDILKLAHERMKTELDRAWSQRAIGLPYDNAYDALIMASIVEKETGVAQERDRIAGVFVRRLRKNMRLQTDPTVIYGLGDAFTGNLRRSHLGDDNNPYNTYRHKGLPPSPIALPGRAALMAAVQPADGTELYFVARGDGSHQFSDTLDEHTEAVRQYQLKRRSDYRSSPGPAQP